MLRALALRSKIRMSFYKQEEGLFLQFHPRMSTSFISLNLLASWKNNLLFVAV